jgi:hypothetical protein
MRKVLASLLVGSLFLVGGCRTLSSVKVHGPPQYDEQGVPSDPYYENVARRTSEMAEEGVIPTDPHEAHVAAMQLVEEAGVDIVPKAEGIEQWEKFTTTFPKTIFVAKNWDEMDEATQAVVLWHEIVHLREYEAHTPLLMGLMYATAEGRWAIEVQAYRESFRVRRLFGQSEEEIQARMLPTAEKLYEAYELGAMPREYALDKAVEIWMEDSR